MEIQQEIKRTVTKGAITVEKVEASQYQKAGTLTATLRQEITITSEYPSKRVGNSMQDSLSPIEDYGFETTTFISKENRVAFPNVAAGTTLEQANALIAASPQACLYKVLANEPILNEDQLYAIQTDLRTKDQFANSQVVRYPADHDVSPNQIIKDPNGNVQYRAVFFSKTAKQDQDWRTAEVAAYVSPEIAMELAGTPVSAALVIEQSI
jgi:hypothetical protein